MLKPISIAAPFPEFCKRVQIKMRIQCNMDLFKRKTGMISLIYEFKGLLKQLRFERRQYKHCQAKLVDLNSKYYHIETSIQHLDMRLNESRILYLNVEDSPVEYFYISPAVHYKS